MTRSYHNDSSREPSFLAPIPRAGSAEPTVELVAPRNFSHLSYLRRVGTWIVSPSDEAFTTIEPYIYDAPRYKLTTEHIGKILMQQIGADKTYTRFKKLEAAPAIPFTADDIKVVRRSADNTKHLSIMPNAATRTVLEEEAERIVKVLPYFNPLPVRNLVIASFTAGQDELAESTYTAFKKYLSDAPANQAHLELGPPKTHV